MLATDTLAVIPARGGSKGIPRKNIKLLAGKPLIAYSVEVARAIVPECNICVSTDDREIAATVRDFCGLPVPFQRPDELATDTAGSNEVLLHALDFFEEAGKTFRKILLLQPTSPLRTVEQTREALELYRPEYDMVTSVTPSKVPAVLCRENEQGFLEFAMERRGNARQAYEGYYVYNGAIYVINPESLRRKGLAGFRKTVKYVMTPESSIDIDTMLDWRIAEALISEK